MALLNVKIFFTPETREERQALIMLEGVEFGLTTEFEIGFGRGFRNSDVNVVLSSPVRVLMACKNAF